MKLRRKSQSSWKRKSLPNKSAGKHTRKAVINRLLFLLVYYIIYLDTSSKSRDICNDSPAFSVLIPGPEIASNCQNNTEIYLHICIIFGLALHNIDKIKVCPTVGMTAITAFQRFGGMMTILKERILHDADSKTATVSE